MYHIYPNVYTLYFGSDYYAIPPHDNYHGRA